MLLAASCSGRLQKNTRSLAIMALSAGLQILTSFIGLRDESYRQCCQSL